MRTQVPVGRSESDGWLADLLRQHIARADNQLALRLGVELRIVFVYPAVNSDFVSVTDNAAGFRGVDEGADGWHKKAGFDVMPRQNLENTGDADATAEFPPGQPAYGCTTAAEFVGFMIAIEGKCDGTSGAARPVRRA